MIEGRGCCYLLGFERLFHSAVIALRYPPPMFSFSLLGFAGLLFHLIIVQEDALHSNIPMELRVGVEGWGALAGWAKKGTDEEGAIAGQGKREGHCRLGSFLVPQFGILRLVSFSRVYISSQHAVVAKATKAGYCHIGTVERRECAFILVCRERAAGSINEMWC